MDQAISRFRRDDRANQGAETGEARGRTVSGKTDVFLAIVAGKPPDERLLDRYGHCYRRSTHHATASLRTARTWLAHATPAGASPHPVI